MATRPPDHESYTCFRSKPYVKGYTVSVFVSSYFNNWRVSGEIINLYRPTNILVIAPRRPSSTREPHGQPLGDKAQQRAAQDTPWRQAQQGIQGCITASVQCLVLYL